MNTHVETDWTEFELPLKVQEQEYSVRVWVFLLVGYEPDPTHFPPWREKITANLEGFESLPPYPPEHEKQIEKEILLELEERYQ